MNKVSLPETDSRRQLARRLLDAGIGQIPGGAFLTAIYSVTHPEQASLLMRAWQEDVTNAINQLVDRIEPTIKLSDMAIEVAKDLCASSTTGRYFGEQFEYEGIQAAFPNMSLTDIRDACGELELDGLVEIHRIGLGNDGRLVVLQNRLFWLFDPLAGNQCDLACPRFEGHRDKVFHSNWRLSWEDEGRTARSSSGRLSG